MPSADPMRPLIAINGLIAEDEHGELTKLSLRNRYAEAVLRGGGIPVVVPPVGGPADLRALLARVDGLVLTGGDDFETERLGLGPTHPRAVPTPAVKQDFDLELCRAALEADVPVLGICYGMQCLSLATGGRLHQHLPDDLPGSQEHTGGVEHEVEVEAGSKLAGLLGVPRLPVVSRHHQALSDPGADWRVTGRDGEGLIEAVEHPDREFAIGVQWHPELSPAGSPHDGLFRGLVTTASVRARRTALEAART